MIATLASHVLEFPVTFNFLRACITHVITGGILEDDNGDMVVFIVKSSNNGKVNNDDSLSSNTSFAVLHTFPLCKLSGDVQSTHTSRTIR